MVEEHLRGCENCKRIEMRMREPEHPDTIFISERAILDVASAGLMKKKKWITVTAITTSVVFLLAILGTTGGYQFQKYYYKDRSVTISADQVSVYGSGVTEDGFQYIQIECRTDIPKDLVGIYHGPGIIDDNDEQKGTSYICFLTPRECEKKEGDRFIQTIYLVQQGQGWAFSASKDHLDEGFYLDRKGNPITRLVYVDDAGKQLLLWEE